MPPRRRWASNLDMYRKVPADLLEGTKRGSILSYAAMIVMATLFMMETMAFFSSRTVTDLALDSNPEKRVRVNFNITMMDLKCDFAVIDVVSVLGENQNVTAHVTKWSIDAEGVRQRYRARNVEQNDLIEMHDRLVTESIEDLHEDGEDAISLDANTLEFARNENEYAFIDFYASWCSHCRDLAPTWETLAEVIDDATDRIVAEKEERYQDEDYTKEEYQRAMNLARPVFIGKIDCVMHKDLCREHNIRAYPTLRMFVDGEKKEDYRGDRTVLEMTSYLKEVEEDHNKDKGSALDAVHEKAMDRVLNDASPEEIQWVEKVKEQKSHKKTAWNDEDHPGCQLYGHLMVDRVPGSFHIQARSSSHDLAPHMTNVSHEIHHLSIGDPVVSRAIEKGDTKSLPLQVRDKLAPMDGNVYVTHALHEAHHHYLKVVTTNLDDWKLARRKISRTYQILENSQLAYYRSDIVPEAKFIYDLSPIAVSYRSSSRRWYDYLTSLMAIIGGMFTVVGMMESSIRAMSMKKRM